MKWSLILTSFLVSAVFATTEEPETTTSRLHRSTFQEQLQWTTPLPTTASLPTDVDVDDAAGSRVDTETEAAPSDMEPHESTEQQKPDMNGEASEVGTKRENSPFSMLDPEATPNSLQDHAEKDGTAVERISTATDGFVDDKQNSSEALQAKPPQKSDGAFAAESAPPVFSVKVEDRKDSSDPSTTSFPPKENPTSDLKSSTAAEPVAPIIVDEGANVSQSAGGSESQTAREIPLKSATSAASDESLQDDSSEVTSSPIDAVTLTSTTDASRLHVSSEEDRQDSVTTELPDAVPNATVNSMSEIHRNDSTTIEKSSTSTPATGAGTTQPDTTTISEQTEQKAANFSERTPLAEVTPEPQLNEVKLSLNASEKEDSSSVEELPALSMMALKSPPLVEFSYKEGTPKPPSQQNIAIQEEPAKPIGEITEDDHVVENSHPTADAAADSEPPQPEGVLEIARKVTKMLEDKYAAEESRLHRRIGNGSSPGLPIVIQRGTTPRPHRVESHSTPDYDYHSIELMRLRAREHNNRDLATEASGRNQELHPRTSKIMNAGNAVPNKDKMIFIKTVPKGSLTTMGPSSTVVTSPPTVTSTSSISTADSDVNEKETNSTSLTTESGRVKDIQQNKGSTPQKDLDYYYDEPTEIVNEEDVVSSPEKPAQETPPQQPDIEPTKVIEDRPVMALVVQNPPNENSLTRKELKPLDTKDVQVSFILPAVSEPSLVPHKDKEATSSKAVTEELTTETINAFTESSLDSRFSKPYPMQRVTTSTTENPTPAPADDRFDAPRTANPMSTLAGGEFSSDTGDFKLECPSKEDIHPCTCVTHEDDYDGQIETVATCRGIKHSATLIEALRGFRGHHLTYLIIDNSDLPPFPNNILHRIQVDWMEVLNTPVQFKREYLQCSIKCTLS